jgi:GTP cyclohydrolase I
VVSEPISWTEVYRRIATAPPGKLYGIPRGGAVVAGLTGRAVDNPHEADWIVDDVIDSGQTSRRFAGRYEKPVWGLFDRARDGLSDKAIALPWDVTDSDIRTSRLEAIGCDLLDALGYSATDDALRDTPRRWAQWWSEFLGYPSDRTSTTFETTSHNAFVMLSGIATWSVCKHHLLPFSIVGSVAYIPRGTLLGLSKFARILESRARRLQLQEDITDEVAEAIKSATGTDDVAILMRGRHLCMEARGVRSGATTTTIRLSGRFQSDEPTRRDFVTLASR